MVINNLEKIYKTKKKYKFVKTTDYKFFDRIQFMCTFPKNIAFVVFLFIDGIC